MKIPYSEQWKESKLVPTLLESNKKGGALQLINTNGRCSHGGVFDGPQTGV